MKPAFSYVTALVALALFSGCMPPANDKSGSGGSMGSYQFIIIGMMIVVFWLFFIRPQAKRAKNQKKFIEDLQKGDKIVTIAGIHGTINKVNEDGTLSIEISPGSYIKIEKSAISMDWTAAINKPAAATPDKK
jgi:preprotein translocase subunit YajC